MSESAVPEIKTIHIAGNAVAPFIYFDHAATYGIQGGAVVVELIARTILPDGAGTKNELVATGHLRCSPDAARELIGALAKALDLMAAPTDPLQRN